MAVIVSCVHCLEQFLMIDPDKSLATCPHCLRKSAVGTNFTTSRGILHCGIGIFFFVASIAITAITYSMAEGGGFYIVYYGGFFFGIASICQGAYYCCCMHFSSVVAESEEQEIHDSNQFVPISSQPISNAAVVG